MKRVDPTEQALDRLSQLREGTDAKTVVSELRKGMTGRSNLVVAKAAKLADELRVHELIPELVAAFERLMLNPVKLDKRCAATFEIATALYGMDYSEPHLYLLGIRHVQLEASFGPPVDEAAKLRAQCALGLARTTHPDALVLVADLLADHEPHARVGAIRALASNGGEAGVALLRFKALTGDTDSDVLAECFSGLLSADFERSLPFVAKFMDNEREDVSESAILAIGAQRRVEAFNVLHEKWERSVYSEIRKTLLTAMAMVRLDEATDFLIGLLESAATPTAVEVIRVLAAYHREDRVRVRVRKLLTERGNAELRKAVSELW